ncbi:MAG: hypothetical protein OXG15_01370 [Gammaproteobacteria bacterium]|nr:hypothetical protein [Gammaproteobacteria bacterium]
MANKGIYTNTRSILESYRTYDQPATKKQIDQLVILTEELQLDPLEMSYFWNKALNQSNTRKVINTLKTFRKQPRQYINDNLYQVKLERID